MKPSLAFLLIFLVGASASNALAVYKMGEKKPMKVNRAPRSSDPSRIEKKPSEEAVLESLSKRFNVGVEQLKYYRSTRHGYEEIVPSLIIAREAQVEVGRILNDRMRGKMWKEIADSFSLDLKPLNEEVVRVLNPIRDVVAKEAMTERPAPVPQGEK